MKSKTSLFNKAVFRHNLTGCFGLWAGLFLVNLVFLPVRFYGGLAEIERYAEREHLAAARISSMPSIIWGSDWAVALAFAGALAAAMFLFSYLFTARNSNMMHTYPVNRCSLFATNYVTGLLFLLVPLTVSVLLALLVSASCGAVTGEIAASLFIWLGVTVAENIFFFSVAVCVLMFVGNMIAVVPLYIILNFLYMGMIRIAEWMVNAVCYGVETFSLSSEVRRVLTPFYYFITLDVYRGSGEDGQLWYSFGEAKVLFVYLAAAAVFTAIALAAYLKKHIETAGDVITVNWLKPIFRWGVAVCTSSLGAAAVSMLLFQKSFAVILAGVIIIGAVVFFIAQMLLERSVHVFKKKRALECLVYTVLICLVYIGLDADILGLERKIPEISEVKEVYMNGGIELYAADSGEIAWAEDIHRQIIDSKKEFERAGNRDTAGDFNSYFYTSFDYWLKDGSRIRRNYLIPRDDAAGSVSSQIEEYADRPEVILKRYFGTHYPDVEVFGGHWEDATAAGEPSVRVSEADAVKIYRAFEEDVRAGRLEAEEGEENDVLYYGSLQLNIRDEAGFRSPTYHWSDPDVEGRAEIYIESQMTSLVKTMKELGYISDTDRKDTD